MLRGASSSGFPFFWPRSVRQSCFCGAGFPRHLNPCLLHEIFLRFHDLSLCTPAPASVPSYLPGFSRSGSVFFPPTAAPKPFFSHPFMQYLKTLNGLTPPRLFFEGCQPFWKKSPFFLITGLSSQWLVLCSSVTSGFGSFTGVCRRLFALLVEKSPFLKNSSSSFSRKADLGALPPPWISLLLAGSFRPLSLLLLVFWLRASLITQMFFYRRTSAFSRWGLSYCNPGGRSLSL